MDRLSEMDSHQSIQEAHKAKLNNIQLEDLEYVEKDLSFYEKVSMTFLLFGATNTAYALQRLLVLSRAGNEDTDILQTYARQNTTKWKSTILEALAIIQANKVIRKLGINPLDTKAQYLPHISRATLHIHPMLKALYFVCESLTVSEAGKLILEINKSINKSSQLQFYDFDYMEVFLLDWLNKSIIDIGEWSDYKTQRPANLDKIIECLKINGFNRIKDDLNRAIERFNFIPESDVLNGLKHLSVDENQINMNQNDCNENDGALARNNLFERHFSTPINPEKCYVVRRDLAGFLLIINQKEFSRETNPELQDLLPKEMLKERKGTDRDRDVLISTFSSFGYIPIVRENLKHYEILEIIDGVIQRCCIYDSLIVCILSHGVEGSVFGSNSIPVDIRRIEEKIAATTLLGKPKILIIQACQGTNLQEARPILKIDTDAPTSAALNSDMLVALSTVPGYASVRHCEKGSWFIQTLCSLIDQHAETKPILDILIDVNCEVSSKRDYFNNCMVPKTEVTLNKSLFLPKRF